MFLTSPTPVMTSVKTALKPVKKWANPLKRAPSVFGDPKHFQHEQIRSFGLKATPFDQSFKFKTDQSLSYKTTTWVNIALTLQKKTFT